MATLDPGTGRPSGSSTRPETVILAAGADGSPPCSGAAARATGAPGRAAESGKTTAATASHRAPAPRTVEDRPEPSLELRGPGHRHGRNRQPGEWAQGVRHFEQVP